MHTGERGNKQVEVLENKRTDGARCARGRPGRVQPGPLFGVRCASKVSACSGGVGRGKRQRDMQRTLPESLSACRSPPIPQFSGKQSKQETSTGPNRGEKQRGLSSH